MVTRQTVVAARKLQREGLSLQAIAIRLNVQTSELDRALWANIDVDDETLAYEIRRPTPMF
jgi:predicted nuclease of restriction endonuclease-like RecB superfamily